MSYITCLDCLSVNVSKATGHAGDAPLVGYECDDCDNEEIHVDAPGRTLDLFDDFESLDGSEVVDRRDAA